MVSPKVKLNNEGRVIDIKPCSDNPIEVLSNFINDNAIVKQSLGGQRRSTAMLLNVNES